MGCSVSVGDVDGGKEMRGHKNLPKSLYGKDRERKERVGRKEQRREY